MYHKPFYTLFPGFLDGKVILVITRFSDFISFVIKLCNPQYKEYVFATVTY